MALALFMRAPEYRLKTRLDRSAVLALGAAFAAAGIVLSCSQAGVSAYGSPGRPIPVAGAAGQDEAGGAGGSGGTGDHGGASGTGDGGGSGGSGG